MSIHKSLKGLDELVRARNVLNRYERLLLLKQKGLWKEEENSILGLPKVRIMRLKKRPKVKEEKPAEGVAAEGAEGAVAAEGEAEVKKEPEKIKKERAEKGEKVEKEKKEKKEK